MKPSGEGTEFRALIPWPQVTVCNWFNGLETLRLQEQRA